jgi:hypothetical protein
MFVAICPQLLHKSIKHACSINRSLKCIEQAKAYSVFLSGEGLEPRPFVRFGRVMTCCFRLVTGTSAFAIFKVIDCEIHAIYQGRKVVEVQKTP